MKIQFTVVIAGLILSASSSFAADAKVSKAEREKMAEIHTKMAACLRSDKPMSDCRSEMRKSCKDMMGKSGCPMMGEMGHMKDMMGSGMMMDHEEENKSDKKGE